MFAERNRCASFCLQHGCTPKFHGWRVNVHFRSFLGWRDADDAWIKNQQKKAHDRDIDIKQKPHFFSPSDCLYTSDVILFELKSAYLDKMFAVKRKRFYTFKTLAGFIYLYSYVFVFLNLGVLNKARKLRDWKPKSWNKDTKQQGTLAIAALQSTLGSFIGAECTKSAVHYSALPWHWALEGHSAPWLPWLFRLFRGFGIHQDRWVVEQLYRT